MTFRHDRFPVEELRPKGGQIHCHIFENPFTGLARNLFWAITVEFEPLEYANDKLSCALTCERIPWPLRNWRELDGKHLDVDYGENGVESSFYVVEHDLATHTTLSLHHRRENRFATKVDMLVDFRGCSEGGRDPALPIHAEVEIPFIGMICYAGSSFPRPASSSGTDFPAEWNRIASEFVDLSVYCAPRPLHGHGFIFPPAVAVSS